MRYAIRLSYYSSNVKLKNYFGTLAFLRGCEYVTIYWVYSNLALYKVALNPLSGSWNCLLRWLGSNTGEFIQEAVSHACRTSAAVNQIPVESGDSGLFPFIVVFFIHWIDLFLLLSPLRVLLVHFLSL